MRATSILVTAGRDVLPTERHGSEGRRERIIREVADPVTGKRRGVVGVVRPRGIDDMHARGRITDRQKDVADRFLAINEMAHSDGVKAIDYGKLRVDCGSDGDLVGGERIVKAVRELERIKQAIGRRGFEILTAVVVERAEISRLAKIVAERSGRSVTLCEGYVGMRLVEALDDLSDFWDLAVGRGNGVRADRGEGGAEMRVEVELVTVAPNKLAGEDAAQVGRAVAKLREEAARRR